MSDNGEQKKLQTLLEYLKSKGFISNETSCYNLFDILESLSVEQYVWIRSNELFTDVLKCLELGSEVENSVLVMSDSDKVDEVTELELPSPDAYLSDVEFGDEIDGLLKLTALGAIFKNEDGVIRDDVKLSDVLMLALGDLHKQKGIGGKYIQSWKQLKILYSGHVFDKKITDIELQKSDINFDDVDFDNMLINYSSLSDGEKKSLNKMKNMGLEVSVKSVANLNVDEFSQRPRVGDTIVTNLSKVKKKLLCGLKKISCGEIEYKKWECESILPKIVEDISVQELHEILLEDIDKFLNGLDDKDDKDCDVFQHRWGFNAQFLVLEKIGNKHGVTRAAIGLDENRIKTKFIKDLRLTVDNIWLVIKDEPRSQLPEKMKDLASCFEKEEYFYKFLNFISGEHGIDKKPEASVKLNVLDGFFALHGLPGNLADIADYLKENTTVKSEEIDISLRYLEDNGKIEIDGDNIHPKNLPKNVAAACILSGHPGGLPWLDVSKLINSKNISRTQIAENRKDERTFEDSEYIYLAGTGCYQHIKYIDFDKINFDDFFSKIHEFIKEEKESGVHLKEACDNIDKLGTNNYYVMRYIVKMYGEEYGIHFKGKSRSDSISRDSDFKGITQKDVILKAMKTAQNPMTKLEVAGLLVSNSMNHASLYLNELINDGRVVQVDKMIYTTPDIGYKDINIVEHVDCIHGILSREGKPVDPSIFEIELNKKFDLSYSKQFYASIAKRYARERNWYRNYNLFSLKEIMYKNLMGAINELCQLNLNIDENHEKLTQKISITKCSAQVAIGNLR